MAKMRGDFTDILVKRQVLSPDQLDEAVNMQRQTGAKNIQEVIVKLGYASIEEVTRAVADFHKVPYIDLTDMTIPPSVIELVPESVARENVILPMAQENGALKIIMSDPTDFDTMQKLQFILNKDVHPVLSPREQIVEAINRHYGQTETESVDSMLSEFTDTAIDFTETSSAAAAAANEDSDAPVIKLCNLMIQEAISLRASDVHIEPFADRVRIRYRIDGILVERDSPPRRLLAPIVARLKVMGGIDISEKRRPQDGRIKTRAPDGQEVELRLSTMPTAFGEKLVMRIFDPEVLVRDFRELGFSEDDKKRWDDMTSKPNGIVLVTGPTGSGKTTTLYSTLKTLATPEVNVCTIEDPIEMVEQSFNQMQVQHQLELGFADGVRALMRQDPDIIMIGEIRDLETAEMAVQAALTGHLVLSTMHTNDAPSAVTRLLELGIPAYLLNATLNGIMAQRLVRTLCPHCKEKAEFNRVEDHHAWDALVAPWKSNRPSKVYKPVGCLECRMTGFIGRVGIYETLIFSSGIKSLANAQSDIAAVRELAFKEGMKPLRISGALKVGMGITTIDEVLKVAPPVRETAER